MNSFKENPIEASLLGGEQYHLRSTAERILGSGTQRSIFLDPLSLPIAGLCSIPTGSEYPTLENVPKEIMPFSHIPIVLIDLDDTVWPHAQHLIQAVGEASGKPITVAELKRYGHSRKIPSWTNDKDVMAIHDQILHGEHPLYFPFVNPAYTDAIRTITATERMGHAFSYVTARPAALFETTKATIKWNRLPIDEHSYHHDALIDDVPRSGFLYCVKNSLPGIADKSDITRQWLKNLRDQGWKGEMVIIDDLINSYGSVIQEPGVIGVALNGDLNANLKQVPHEIRVDSWRDISEILKDVHSRAVARNGSPTRDFVLSGKAFSFDKQQTGCGAFTYSSAKSLPIAG